MEVMTETITILVISEILMERSEDGTLYEIDKADPQYIAYRNIEDVEDHLENEWNKTIYDGVYDSDYDEWRFVAQTEKFNEDDDLYKGFERIFRTEDGKQVSYEVTIEPAILVV